jgi:membrane fusion protein (multidrug efflux system)
MWIYFNVPESEYLNFVRKGKNNIKSKVQLRLASKEIFECEGNIETIEGEFNNETGNLSTKKYHKRKDIHRAGSKHIK